MKSVFRKKFVLCVRKFITYYIYTYFGAPWHATSALRCPQCAREQEIACKRPILNVGDGDGGRVRSEGTRTRSRIVDVEVCRRDVAVPARNVDIEL